MVFCLMLWALYSNVVLAASLPQRSERIGNLAAGPTSSSNLLSPATLAPSSYNSSANLLKIACSTKWGKNLKVYSCRNIFDWLQTDERQFSFAERDSGLPYQVPLPLRTYSSKTLDIPLRGKSPLLGLPIVLISLWRIGNRRRAMLCATFFERRRKNWPCEFD